MYNLVIVEDLHSMRMDLVEHFSKSENIQCIFSTDSAERLQKFSFGTQTVHVILLDINLPFKSGIDILPTLRKKHPDTEIIMYTILDDNDKIFQSLCNGASGYLLKNQNFEVLESQLVDVLTNGGSAISPQIARRIIQYFNPDNKPQKEIPLLTETEIKIVQFLKDALTYHEIAKNLNITIHGIRYHIVNIYKKLQVKTKQQAINRYDSFLK